MKNLISPPLRKITIMLCFAFLMPSIAMAQGMPVYDNTNFISLAKQLVESAKQTTNLLKTVEFLKQQKERIEKVSNVIQQLDAVSNLIQNNQQLYQLVQQDLQEILSSPYIKPEEVDQVSESFDEILQRSTQNVNYIDKILTSDYLKMSDGERAAILKAYEETSSEMLAEVNNKTQRYRSIISFRKMQDKINNRETDF